MRHLLVVPRQHPVDRAGAIELTAMGTERRSGDLRSRAGSWKFLGTVDIAAPLTIVLGLVHGRTVATRALHAALTILLELSPLLALVSIWSCATELLVGVP
jgi:hypothetical protein